MSNKCVISLCWVLLNPPSNDILMLLCLLSSPFLSSCLFLDSANILVCVEDPALPSFCPSSIRPLSLSLQMMSLLQGSSMFLIGAELNFSPFGPDSNVGPSGTVHWYWILSRNYLYSALHWRPKHIQVQTDPNLVTPGAVVIFSLRWSSIACQSWIMNYKPAGFGRFDPYLSTPAVTGWKAGTHIHSHTQMQGVGHTQAAAV